MKIFVLGLFISMTAFLAIPISGQDMRFGLRAGLNSSNVWVEEDAISFDRRRGIGIGAMAGLQLNPHMGLSLEPAYMQKGAKHYELAYLEVPLMARYTFRTRHVEPYVTAGPYAAYLLSAVARVNDLVLDFKDRLKSVDFGVNVGAGIGYPVGSFTVFLEGRYSMGLTGFNDSDEPDTYVAKTRGVQVFAGITFPIGN